MINELRLKVTGFLGIPLVETNYFYVDSWTFIHLISGFLGLLLIFKLFKKIKITSKFFLLFVFIFFWEIFELSISWIKLETSIDIIYDLITGMLGGWLFYLVKNKFRVFSQ